MHLHQLRLDPKPQLRLICSLPTPLLAHPGRDGGIWAAIWAPSGDGVVLVLDVDPDPDVEIDSEEDSTMSEQLRTRVRIGIR